MSVFNVELKKIVDDSYEIEVGHELEQKLIDDINAGLVGNIRKFAVVTDSNVKELYAEKICGLLEKNGYKCDLIVFPAGETSKTRETKEFIEDTMLEKGYRRDCCIIAVGGGDSSRTLCSKRDTAAIAVSSLSAEASLRI